MFGVGGENIIAAPNPSKMFSVHAANIVVFNEPARRLMICMKILQDMVKHMEGRARGEQALFTANEIMNGIELGDNRSVQQALDKAEKFLGHPNPLNSSVHYALGHCHIDTAWLWDYDETKRKCARSWSSQVDLMSRFPEYTFVCSQMQQLEWIRDKYPALFGQLKEYHEQGQFVPIGGTWVEMDGNMPNGESMVRQFLYGQTFLKEHFGEKTSVFWLPDTFGYSAQLPQIMKHCGIEYFVSQKLSWNNINQFPHNTFHWVALDGKTSVLSHFPPSNTYGANVEPHELLQSLERNKDNDRCPNSLLLFGHGDGGGGPTEDMLLRMEYLRDCDGLGRVEPKVHPHGFFKQLDGDKLLRWQGELYFELHRGTYTSQAAIKQYNRRCERLLRDAELLAVLDGLITGQTAGKRTDYPKALLDGQWKTVLLNQFHDVLPGSSINKVYKDAIGMYERVENSLGDCIRKSMESIIASMSSEREDPNGKANGPVVFNTLSFTRSEVTKPPFGDDTELILNNIQPMSITSVADVQDVASTTKTVHGFGVRASFISPHYCLENSYVLAAFDEKGRLLSLYDKAEDREIMDGAGNELLLFEDIPIFWDAWDVELYHLEKYRRINDAVVAVHQNTSGRASLIRKTKISDQSSIVQIISLTATSPLLTFDCKVDWGETHQMLKVEFPVAIHTDHASYETQYGIIRRPTTTNTSWEVAKFEVCGLRFMDLSEHNYGVGLLADSKYGYSVSDGNRMRLSLLRSPKSPDPECDQGEHVFKFAVFPHTGGPEKAVEEAQRFCSPLLLAACNGRAALDPRWLGRPFFEIPGMVVDCVKKAEADDNIVIRAYEAVGGRGKTVLRHHPELRIEGARRVNGLEEDLDMALVRAGACAFHINYTPFQLVSLKIILRGGL